MCFSLCYAIFSDIDVAVNHQIGMTCFFQSNAKIVGETNSK